MASLDEGVKNTDILKHIDVLKLAFREAMTLTGLADVTAALSVMQTLYKMDIKQTLLSLGGDGFMINDKTDIHHFTALEEAPLATSGAGDCFWQAMFSVLLKICP